MEKRTPENNAHPIQWLRAAYHRALEGEPREVVAPFITHPDSGEIFRCWIWPETVREQDRLLRARGKGGMEAILETVLVKCKDREGKRIFHDAHRAMLQQECLAEPLVDLVLLINTADPPDTRDPEVVGN